MLLPKGYRFVHPPSVRFSHLFQRPQQLMIALAKLGYETYFVDWGRPTQPRMDLPPEFHLVYSMNDVPKDRVVLWSTQGAHLKKLAGLFHDPIKVFDFVDSNDGYEHVLQHQIGDGLAHADMVFAVSHDCVETSMAKGVDAEFLPNAADFEHFSARVAPSPTALSIRRKGHPIICFYGAVYPWVDTGLIMEVARLRPGYTFLVIGPRYGEPLKGAPENLIPFDHVPYRDLPSITATADAFILPFKVDPMTNASDPIKLWEYLATGKPVVATPINAAREQTLAVRIADGPEGFSMALDEAVVESEWAPIRWIRRNIARENSWDARARRAVEVLGTWLERRTL